MLRFDFTGIGSSEGEFANTNFSSNVRDLVAAANYLRQSHAAPSLLIGHSLGGAAVLAGAPHVPEATGVVTIGAPSSAAHVTHNFAADLAEIAAGPVVIVHGGISAWRAAARPFESSPGEPPDDQRIDFVFWNHDRHAGNQEAMRAYLRWETELPGEVARDGLASFRLTPS